MSKYNSQPGWNTRGKSISQLIEELKTFEDQTLQVMISVDDGKTQRPISMVGKSEGVCLLEYCSD